MTQTRLWRVSSVGTGGVRVFSLLKAFWALGSTWISIWGLGFLGRIFKRTLPRHQHSLPGCKTRLPGTAWTPSKERWSQNKLNDNVLFYCLLCAAHCSRGLICITSFYPSNNTLRGGLWLFPSCTEEVVKRGFKNQSKVEAVLEELPIWSLIHC